MITNEPRRGWLRNAGLLIGGVAALSTSPRLVAQAKGRAAAKKGGEDEKISLGEDLMREHGVLKRVLLIYQAIMNRIDSKWDFPPDMVISSAKLIPAFVEDYHERLEEDYLFPRFRKANKLVALVDVLNQQHQKGRVLTDKTLQLASPSALKDASQRANLRNMLYQFVRMYEPHEAREDTILFPAFRKIVSEHEYDALGEEFEKKAAMVLRRTATR